MGADMFRRNIYVYNVPTIANLCSTKENKNEGAIPRSIIQLYLTA
jgi:hypothetical protein